MIFVMVSPENRLMRIWNLQIIWPYPNIDGSYDILFKQGEYCVCGVLVQQLYFAAPQQEVS